LEKSRNNIERLPKTKFQLTRANLYLNAKVTDAALALLHPCGLISQSPPKTSTSHRHCILEVGGGDAALGQGRLAGKKNGRFVVKDFGILQLGLTQRTLISTQRCERETGLGERGVFVDNLPEENPQPYPMRFLMRYTLSLLLVAVCCHTLQAQDTSLTPQVAVKRMTVPEGFRVRLYAGEPHVLNPIAMTLDDRGRLWVVESHSYPHWIKDGKPGKDRVLIFEGQKKDGSFEKCTVFLDNGTNLSGIALGHGGVWLAAVPNLIFIPTKPGEDKPAGPAKVLLDGFEINIKHNVVNNLHWGPDGWLYGCHGILATSYLGLPGTPKDKRVPFNCGVWRYHPAKKIVEPYAWGTTNPFGLDWDDYGEMFITNCVIKHAFHVIPGAHFVRMYGEDLVPNTYGLIESCADHTHWAGGHWTNSRGAVGAHDEAGGGHAHSGAMVYLADAWPKEYRNQLFMGNLHGSRINMDRLETKGSGYVSKRGLDIMKANDPWFRPITVIQSADGNVFVSDWHDTGECHNYDKTYPSGRIYRLEYVKADAPKYIEIAECDDLSLAENLTVSGNDWAVRRARVELQRRALVGKIDARAVASLRANLHEDKDARRGLRRMWALHGIGELGEADLLRVLKRDEAPLRVWAVRLAVEDRKVSPEMLARFVEMAKADPAASVRLALASALQRLSLEARWPIAERLAAHKEDTSDLNLPLMIWYGIEPLVKADPVRAVSLLKNCAHPVVRQHLSRRVAVMGEDTKGMQALLTFLRESHPHVQRDMLAGLHDAFRGRRGVPMPPLWKEMQAKLWQSGENQVRERAISLSLIFGDKEAPTLLRTQLADAKEKTEIRRWALHSLVETKADKLLPILRELIADPELRVPALRALGGQADKSVPAIILKEYAKFGAADKEAAIASLSGRPEFALALLDAVEKKLVPRSDISALAARQLQALKDKTVSKRLTEVWGTLRPTAGAKKELLTKYLAIAAPDAIKTADQMKGHQLFTKHCASCHKLFGEGGAIGPELTGSQRTNPEYLLSKLLDPSAAVNKDYQMSVVILEDGRTLTGIVKEETPKTLALQTPMELIRLSKGDVQSRKMTGLSMMPEGLLQSLSAAEVRSLIAYLGGEGPVK